MERTLNNVLSEICIAIGFIFILMIINWMIIFWKCRDIPALKESRRPNIILAIGAFSISSIIEVMVFLITWGTSYGADYINEDISRAQYSWAFMWFWTAASHLVVLHLITYRILINFIEIKLEQILENEAYDGKFNLIKSMIESDVSTSVYAKYGKYLTEKYIACMFIFVWLVEVVLGLTFIRFRILSSMILFVSALSSTVMDVVLYRRFPMFDDAWHFYEEIQFTTIAKIVCQTFLFISNIILFPNPTTPAFTMTLFTKMLQIIIILSVLYAWIFKKFKIPQVFYSVNKYLEIREEKFIEFEKQMSGRSVENETDLIDNTNVRLENIMETQYGFRLFAQHLEREHLMENLLFFMETQQWLNSVMFLKRYENSSEFEKVRITANESLGIVTENDVCDTLDAGTMDELKCNEISMKTNKAPSYHSTVNSFSFDRDSLQFSNMTEMEVVCIHAAEIFRAFIAGDYSGGKVGDVSRVNVSVKVSQTLFELFDFNQQMDISSEESIHVLAENLKNSSIANGDEFFDMFDDGRDEIYVLLQNSFERFRNGPAFKKFVEKSNADIMGL